MADLLSAISVFLVFLTFLFNSIEKEINETINTRKPENKQKEMMKLYRRNLRRVTFLKSLPITLIYLVSFYTLLPSTINILKTSKFDFWHFDELNTLFVFIEIGILGLAVYAAIKTWQLFTKL